MKRVIHMARTICYEEVCKPDDKIHLRSTILLILSVAVVITAAVVAQHAYAGLVSLEFSLFPTDF
jgi:hypothetical protein